LFCEKFSRKSIATAYEDKFLKVVEIDRQAKQRELNALNTRDREIDNLFNRMYEDNASGRRVAADIPRI
jgi:hypothetical protein